MPNFGNETLGGSVLDIKDVITGSWFTCPEDGTADSIAVAIKLTRPISASLKSKCAIYRKLDNSLVGATEEVTTSFAVNETKWVTHRFSSPVSLRNEDYYLVVWSPSYDCGLFYNTISGKGVWQDLAYDSWPNPLSPASDNRLWSIFCSYTPGAPPPTHRLRVESEPVSVPVMLNGAPIGNTPVEADVEEGDHTVGVPEGATTP